MAKGAGRDFYLEKNNTRIAAIRVTNVNWNGTPIDVTSGDDDGVTTYLSNEFANTTLELSIEGLSDSDVLSDLAFSTTDSDKHMSDIKLVRHNDDEISGTFIMTSYSETGNYQEATTFSATLVRSGAHTFTQA